MDGRIPLQSPLYPNKSAFFSQNAHSLVQETIDNSKSEDGTWSYEFLCKVNYEVSLFKQVDTKFFIDRLIPILNDEKTEIQIKFKIAQMLSFLKSLKVNGFSSVIHESKEELTLILKSFGNMNQPLEKATRNLIESVMMTVSEDGFPVSHRNFHVKSSSVPP
ncbi:hypothetical protein TRFO_37099 [Tritrichomonas foetus]|uniref:Uncharacterized protein n=1 Tax=Tritrichomonas foetus TaxID=1144522 RepID=A0A1J4JC54_9EUKA|nr:hypothetical protein TRFO_37099 [Tritrichomonas foetus]|eukprot:OHS96720.1 hypothetical protein TRFO_37099 [Tritrichomonas foetus]